MARPRTGQCTYRRGRWIARVLLHREPRTASGEYRVAQVDVTRGGQPVTGKGPADKSYARRYAQGLQGRYDEGLWSPARDVSDAASSTSPASTGSAMTVGAWVKRWLGEQTYSEAERDLARVEAYLPRCALGSTELAKVTPRDVARFVAELRALPSPKTEKPPAPRTVRNIYDVVRRALKAAVFEGMLASDPTTSLPSAARPRVVDAKPEARAGYRLGLEQVVAMLRASTWRWRVLWTLLVFTGARLGEALALRWRDIVADAPLRRVVIARQVHHRTREITATKTRELRCVPEHPSLRAALDAWRRDGWPAEYGREPTEDDLILPARGKPGRRWGAADGSGGPLWAQDVYRALQRDLKAALVPGHRVHDLRHTFASLCADAGMRENVAARWTHTPGGASARHLYALPSWAAQCAEMMLLRLDLPDLSGVSVPDSRTG